MVAQLVRALACHARGRGFEPHPSRHFSSHLSASVAQLVEQRTENPRVVGSIPTGGTIYADLAHLVERHLAKVEVAGSSPVIRSKRSRSSDLDFSFCFVVGLERDLSESHSPRLSPPQVCGSADSLLGRTPLIKTTLSCFYIANP